LIKNKILMKTFLEYFASAVIVCLCLGVGFLIYKYPESTLYIGWIMFVGGMIALTRQIIFNR